MSRKTLFERFLTLLGDIKVFGWRRPLWVLYQPDGYRVRGEEVREVMAAVRPGDLLVRGFFDYLDGRFIPGYFSHVGFYLGEVTEPDRERARVVARGRCIEPAFRTGTQMVVHAVAEGVLLEDVIDFCRCDYLAVLRFPAMLRAAPGAPPALVKESSYSGAELGIRDRLAAGEMVSFGEALPFIRAAALGTVGSDYDFSFDCRRVDRFSCAGLAYFVTKSVAAFHRVEPRVQRVAWVFRRSLIEPDAFVRSPLEVVWRSRAVDERRLAALRDGTAAAGVGAEPVTEADALARALRHASSRGSAEAGLARVSVREGAAVPGRASETTS